MKKYIYLCLAVLSIGIFASWKLRKECNLLEMSVG